MDNSFLDELPHDHIDANITKWLQEIKDKKSNDNINKVKLNFLEICSVVSLIECSLLSERNCNKGNMIVW